MIVDDSGLARRMLHRILEPAGHQVCEAENGIVALERYFLDKPDLVLLDLTMAEMYGLDVLEKLLEMDANVRVIVASADTQRFTRELVKAAGARGIVNKPAGETTVLNIVDAVLEGEDQWN